MITVSFKGIGDLKKKINDFKKQVPKEIDAELRQGAEDIRADAVREAPFGAGGGLQRGIQKEKKGPLNWEVVSNAKYSGFVEFGTGGKVSIPAGLEEIAMEVKNAAVTGTAEQAIESLTDWARLKKIKIKSGKKTKSGKEKFLSYEETAKVLFIRIMKYGMAPHPFFFKQFDKHEKDIVRSVEKVIEKI